MKSCKDARRFLLYLLLLFRLADISGAFVGATLNANHIFNAIQSSMRQWGSSLNHNGMSFFLATVPEGVHLYHGTPNAARVQGLQWLALEPEHAMNFAWDIVDCDYANVSMSSKPLSKWLDPRGNMQLSLPVGGRLMVQSLLKPPKRPPPDKEPLVCIAPGYFHTYATVRDLNLLYIDGMSAAKTSNGTMDSQEHILLYDSPERPPFDDWSRAKNLCQIARNHWQGKIDGFIRMEHGFELVLCDFANVDLVSVLAADHGYAVHDRLHNHEAAAAEMFNFFASITSRYFGVGGERVMLYYDSFVTAYSFPELDLFPSNAIFPRLTSIPYTSARQVFSHISDMALNHQPNPSGPNWQSITTLLTTRYSRHLQLFSKSPTFRNSTELHRAIHMILGPYISTADRNTTLEVDRCATAFLPYHLHSLPQSSQSLAHRSFLTVSTHLCSTLFSILNNETLTLHDQRAVVKGLMDYLSWPEFKYCSPACELNEVCFTAIWPWGNISDIERPSCKNGMGILESRGDWDMRWRPHDNDDDEEEKEL